MSSASTAIYTLQRSFFSFALVYLLSSCATYNPQPLPKKSTHPESVENLAAKINSQLTLTKTHEIVLSDGLDLTEIAIMAVLGNPDLNSKRQVLKVAEAQVFSTSLLPDPQLTLNIDQPAGNVPGLVNATGLGLTYDIIPLITRQARLNTEQAAMKQVQLELLWQEWQVMQQARTLSVRYKLEEKQISLLNDIQKLHEVRYRQSEKAVEEGNVTMDVNGTDLSAFMDSSSQLYQVNQTHNQTKHDLNLLIGIDPNARIAISELPSETIYEKSIITAQLEHLSEIRPDLLALKAGYQSQESRVRSAILAQFPTFSLGIQRSRDTGNIVTNGINIGLSIPLFSGNRGTISVARATRKQLLNEYNARLLQANSDVSRLLDLQDIANKQQLNLERYLPILQNIVVRGRTAYGRGDLNALTFVSMETTWINRELEKLAVEQSLWEINLALQSLLALPGNSILTHDLKVSNER